MTDRADAIAAREVSMFLAWQRGEHRACEQCGAEACYFAADVDRMPTMCAECVDAELNKDRPTAHMFVFFQCDECTAVRCRCPLE